VNGEDFYDVLDVSKDADVAEIQKAYRKLAFKYHPDKNPDDPKAADNFKRVSEAYEVLSDPEKRKAYDTRGMAGVHETGFHGFENTDEIVTHFGDIFGDLFGNRFYGQRSGPRRGRDLRFVLPLSFAEAALGGRREVEIPTRDTSTKPSRLPFPASPNAGTSRGRMMLRAPGR
jgi:molecular chaperone DnaJ